VEDEDGKDKGKAKKGGKKEKVVKERTIGNLGTKMVLKLLE
jgi:hypothetical protein